MLEKLKHIHRTLQEDQIYKLILLVVFMDVVAGMLISRFEGLSFSDSVWWSIVTMTTIGYGDISPKTSEGRCVAVFLMIFGISIICMLTAKIAEFLVHTRMNEIKGFNRTKLKNHIIICNWNGRAQEIIRSIKSSKKYKGQKIVVIDDKVDGHLLLHEGVTFYKGVLNDKILKSACLHTATTAIVLGDSSLDHMARDARCVLDTLMIESINPDVYTIVELVDNANEIHCKRAHADEVISGFTMGGSLIAQAALNHGVSSVISHILSANSNKSLNIVDCPTTVIGKSFMAAFETVKRDMNMILLGIQNTDVGMSLNPDNQYIIQGTSDRLIVLCNS